MKIHYIQPYALDKNIGREYNEACALIPEEDWICITDHDVMFLEPKTKQLIHFNAIIAQEQGYGLLGCVTNRLGHEPGQNYNGRRSNDPDVRNHIDLAQDLRLLQGNIITEYEGPIAGMLMLFPAKLWKEIRFVEGKYTEVTFDTHFTQCVRNRGYKVGLMQGVYVFHLYRFGQDNPQSQIKHLA